MEERTFAHCRTGDVTCPPALLDTTSIGLLPALLVTSCHSLSTIHSSPLLLTFPSRTSSFLSIQTLKQSSPLNLHPNLSLTPSKPSRRPCFDDCTTSQPREIVLCPYLPTLHIASPSLFPRSRVPKGQSVKP